MLKGIKTLAEDIDTKVIVLVSKPPSPDVAERILAAAAACGKPVVVIFLGADLKAKQGEEIYSVETLEDAAHAAVQLSKGGAPGSAPLRRHGIGENDVQKIAGALSPNQKYVRGLYSGGTFSYEAMLLLDREIGPVNSSSPLKAEHKLNNIWSSIGNTVIDLGDDFFTRGRPHPMIDHRLRNDRILDEARDPETAVILLDVVIGHGSHADPAGEMAASIEAAKAAAKKNGGSPIFVTFVCGTKSDPQNLAAQENKLRDAGAIVLESNAQAVRLTSDILLAIGGEK